MPGIKDIGGILRSEVIPSEVKDLMVSVISQLHNAEAAVVGNIELAYRRGLAKGQEDTNDTG